MPHPYGEVPEQLSELSVMVWKSALIIQSVYPDIRHLESTSLLAWAIPTPHPVKPQIRKRITKGIAADDLFDATVDEAKVSESQYVIQ